MPIADRLRSLLSRVSAGPYEKKDKPYESNLSNGGHTGYHPVPPKKQRQKAEESEQNVQNGYTGNVSQGYTGYMNPEAVQGDPGAVWGQGWQGNQQLPPQAWGQGWQGGQQPQNAWENQAPVQSWQQDPQTAFTAQAAPQPTGFMQGQQFSGQQPVAGNGFQQAAQQPMGEMHFMPGTFVHEDNAYTHVERLAQPLSAASCFRLIEFMRNGESIIVNTEKIQDERENTHCLDLLFGAAFTMGYTFTKISSMRIYLISPANIMVLPYGSIRQQSEEEIARRWPGATPTQQTQPPQGFDFNKLDRDMEGFVPQRRYS